MTQPWHLDRMCAFDLETTGVDPETARIVTACVVQAGGGHPAQFANWVADPGVPIPDEAAKIHGYTTDRARTEGAPAPQVIEEVTAALVQTLAHGVPVVAMNARYDLTVIDREARRHGITPLTETVGEDLRVVDPLVIDKAMDLYRRGPRTLTALCAHYRVQLDSAHDAAADAIAAARVAWRQGSMYEQLGAMSLEELHAAQIGWAAEQAASLRAYFARTPGKEHQAAGVRSGWPLIPFKEATDAR